MDYVLHVFFFVMQFLFRMLSEVVLQSRRGGGIAFLSASSGVWEGGAAAAAECTFWLRSQAGHCTRPSSYDLMSGCPPG